MLFGLTSILQPRLSPSEVKVARWAGSICGVESCYVMCSAAAPHSMEYPCRCHGPWSITGRGLKAALSQIGALLLFKVASGWLNWKLILMAFQCLTLKLGTLTLESMTGCLGGLAVGLHSQGF
jgi:hypothetical protein